MNLNNPRIAVHTIKDKDDLGFEPVEYSRFKYGDLEIAKKFGQSLFEYFLNQIQNKKIPAINHLIVYSSPYTYLPTSSLLMTNEFYRLLSDHINVNSNLSLKLDFGKIKRSQTYSEDYGSLSAKERFNMIKNDTYELDEVPAENAILLFIDDISITGTHQKVIEKLLFENNIRNESLFYYYAKLENDTIPPNFENYLNYAYVKGVEGLIEIMLSPDFRNTTRTTKFILQLDERDLSSLISSLIENKKAHLIKEIYIGAYKNNYYDLIAFTKNLNILKSVMKMTDIC